MKSVKVRALNYMMWGYLIDHIASLHHYLSVVKVKAYNLKHSEITPTTVFGEPIPIPHP